MSAGVASPIPLGIWKEPESGLLVRTHPCDQAASRLCGTIVGVPDHADQKDTNNPDPELRGRPLLGLQILTDFEAAGDNLWQGGGERGRRPGRIYLPLDGDTLGDHRNRYEIEIEGDRLVVRVANCFFLGCWMESEWKRVE